MKYRIWDKEEETYTNDVFIKPNGKLCYYTVKIGEECYEIVLQANFIVELSTGLFDKNGKEIYEGDLIQHYAFTKGDVYAVEYDERNASFESCGCASEWRDCEVIGTIHDKE